MISCYSQRDVFYLKFPNKIIESFALGILDFHALFMCFANAILHKCLAYTLHFVHTHDRFYERPRHRNK